MHLIIIAMNSVPTLDLMCHIKSSKLVPGSWRFTWALLSSYSSCKRGWMDVLNHSIKLMEEFKLLQAQETRGLLLCFLTHNTAFKVRSLRHLSNEGKVACVCACTGAHIRMCKKYLKSFNKNGLFLRQDWTQNIFKWELFPFFSVFVRQRF